MCPALFCSNGRGERLERDPRRGDRRRRSGRFTGPRVAGAEPAKSTTNRPSSIVTVTSMRIGSSVMPSSSSQSTAVHDPCGSAATASRVARSAWATNRRRWPRRRSARPNFATMSISRRSPVRSVATWAWRSPMHELGHAGVEADQLDDLAVEHATVEHLGAREERSPPGARRSSRARSPGPWRRGPSSARGRTRTRPARRRRCHRARPEHRREQRRVVGVRGVPVRVVEQHDVAAVQVLPADVLDALAERVVVGAEEAGEPRRLGDQAAGRAS